MSAGITLLARRALRDLWARRYRVAAICLIAGIGMAMFTGVYSAIASLFETRDAYHRRGHMADLEIRFIPEDRINLPSFDDIADLTASESRLLMPANIELKDGRRLSATLVALDVTTPPATNRLLMLEGQALDPAQPNEIVIERSLAQYHGFAMGDRVHLTVGQDHYYDLRVRGIALSPEYLIASANPSFFLPTKGSLAIVFAPQALVAQRLGYHLVNSLLFRFDAGADAVSLAQRVTERADERLAVEESIPLTRQFSYLFLNVDLNAFALFIPAIVLVFTVTAVVITLFLLFQWVVSQRREIGVLMALGYGNTRLVLAYLVPVAGMATAGIAAGYGLSFVTLEGFGLNFARATGMPPPLLGIVPRLVAWGAGGVVAGLAVAAIWPQARLLTLTPQDAVRGERAHRAVAMGRGLRRLVSRIGGRLWLRYALRNLLRAKGVSAMTVVSVAMALAVSLSYFVSMTSFERSAIGRFDRDRWEIAADFLAPVWEDELGMLAGIAGVRAIEPYVRGSIRLAAGERHASSLLAGTDPTSALRDVALVDGRRLKAGDVDAILLERKLARDLGLAVGDRLRIDARGREFSARLVGIFSGALPGESFAPLDTARRWLDLAEQSTGVLLQADPPLVECEAALYRLDRVGSVTLKSRLKSELLQVIQEALVILYLAEAFSIAVAVLFVFASVAFMVLERRSDYAMLRILGFSDRVVGLTIVTEVMLLGLIGACLALPLAWGISAFLNRRLSDAWFSVDTVAGASDVLIVMLPALLLLPLAAIPAVRTIRAAPLARTLRERMFG